MDEQKIRQVAKEVAHQEVQNYNAGARFQLNPIQRHIHNNLDSPYAFQPIVNYIGLIEDDGTADLLPKGWTAELVTNYYVITHNLGLTQGNATGSPNALYSVVVQNQGGSFLMSIVLEFPNFFIVEWANYLNVGHQTSFGFNLTLINNRSTQLPIYTGKLIQ